MPWPQNRYSLLVSAVTRQLTRSKPRSHLQAPRDHDARRNKGPTITPAAARCSHGGHSLGSGALLSRASRGMPSWARGAKPRRAPLAGYLWHGTAQHAVRPACPRESTLASTSAAAPAPITRPTHTSPCLRRCTRPHRAHLPHVRVLSMHAGA